MKTLIHLSALIFAITFLSCRSKKKATTEQESKFAKEMVEFTPCKENPLFTGTGMDTWDNSIRERGYILNEDGQYKMWYSGYKGENSDPKYLGYATSADGINWDRYSDQPIFSEKWTEDIFVINHEDTYYMFAEGAGDLAHLLISKDGISWEEQGDLIMLKTNGDTIPHPYGTPTAWFEDGEWYLFYERDDLGIWLATSDDLKTWKNIQDEPVIKMGPEKYDEGAVAANQVVKYKGKYYLYYHGSSNPDWADPDANALWTSNVAMSTDLINWEKYPGNPLVEGDTSSPILVFDGEKHRLYTMHDKVAMYLPK